VAAGPLRAARLRQPSLFGLERNARLVARIAPEFARAQAAARRSKRPERRFADFRLGDAHQLEPPAPGGRQGRMAVYCARGDMENRIKECQVDLFADRTSAATMRANQLRLWFASMAYVLVTALRRIGLAGTELATATCGSIRLKLLKIGALVTRSVRRIRVAMASSCPDAAAFRLAHARLCG
jgi:hypothetical protein